MMKTIRIFAIAFLGLALISCNKENSGDMMKFDLNVQTKSTLVESALNFKEGNFKVKAYEGTSLKLDCLSEYRGGTWVPSETYFWPKSTEMDIYAWTPSSESFVVDPGLKTMSLSAVSISDPLDQDDILLAHYNGTGVNGTAILTFYHIFSGIRISVSGATATSIILSGLYSGGSCSVECEKSPEIIWSSQSDVRTFTSEAENVNFIIPQKAPSGAKITVSLTDGGELKNFDVNFSGYEFKPGRISDVHLSYHSAMGASVDIATLDFNEISSF